MEHQRLDPREESALRLHAWFRAEGGLHRERMPVHLRRGDLKEALQRGVFRHGAEGQGRDRPDRVVHNELRLAHGAAGRARREAGADRWRRTDVRGALGDRSLRRGSERLAPFHKGRQAVLVQGRIPQGPLLQGYALQPGGQGLEDAQGHEGDGGEVRRSRIRIRRQRPA